MLRFNSRDNWGVPLGILGEPINSLYTRPIIIGISHRGPMLGSGYIHVFPWIIDVFREAMIFSVLSCVVSGEIPKLTEPPRVWAIGKSEFSAPVAFEAFLLDLLCFNTIVVWKVGIWCNFQLLTRPNIQIILVDETTQLLPTNFQLQNNPSTMSEMSEWTKLSSSSFHPWLTFHSILAKQPLLSISIHLKPLKPAIHSCRTKNGNNYVFQVVPENRDPSI